MKEMSFIDSIHDYLVISISDYYMSLSHVNSNNMVISSTIVLSNMRLAYDIFYYVTHKNDDLSSVNNRSA